MLRAALRRATGLACVFDSLWRRCYFRNMFENYSDTISDTIDADLGDRGSRA
jgi:hypothetical protein